MFCVWCAGADVSDLYGNQLDFNVVGICVWFWAAVQQVTEGNQTRVSHPTPGVLGTKLTGVAKLSPAQQFDPLHSPVHLTDLHDQQREMRDTCISFNHCIFTHYGCNICALCPLQQFVSDQNHEAEQKKRVP